MEAIGPDENSRQMCMFVNHMFIRSFWKTLLCLLVISLLSLLPLKDVNKTPLFNITHIDKVVHFVMYLILSAFLIQGISRYRTRLKPLIQILYTAGLVVIYGGIIEYIQLAYITLREGDLIDFFFNIAGCLCGIALYRIYSTMKMSGQI